MLQSKGSLSTLNFINIPGESTDVFFNQVVVFREESNLNYFPERYWHDHLDFMEIQCWVNGENVLLGNSHTRYTNDTVEWVSNYSGLYEDSHRNAVDGVITYNGQSNRASAVSWPNNNFERWHWVCTTDVEYNFNDIEVMIFYSILKYFNRKHTTVIFDINTMFNCINTNLFSIIARNGKNEFHSD